MVTLTESGKVQFRAYFPSANSVRVAGDFTGWGAAPVDLTPEPGGWWSTTLRIPPGEYAFHYLVNDSRWETDFAAFGVEMTRLGSWVSRLYVPKTPTRQTAPAA